MVFCLFPMFDFGSPSLISLSKHQETFWFYLYVCICMYACMYVCTYIQVQNKYANYFLNIQNLLAAVCMHLHLIIIVLKQYLSSEAFTSSARYPQWAATMWAKVVYHHKISLYLKILWFILFQSREVQLTILPIFYIDICIYMHII